MTKHFSKELAEVLAGPPKISQSDFGKKAKLIKSKLSRLLNNVIACDQRTLAAVISALPHKDTKLRVLNAYLQDVVGSEVLALLTSGREPFAQLELSGMSSKGQEKLRAIMQSAHLEDLERIIIDLARAWGM
jgi:hypothetical protein